MAVRHGTHDAYFHSTSGTSTASELMTFSSLLLLSTVIMAAHALLTPTPHQLTPSPAQPRTIIIGGGIHGASIAYHLQTRFGLPSTIVEKHSIASAASGKSGGFLAREWGSGPTVALHQKSFDMHASLAQSLGVESFRQLGVLSVTGGAGAGPGGRGDRGSKGTSGVSWLDRDARSVDMGGAAGQVRP